MCQQRQFSLVGQTFSWIEQVCHRLEQQRIRRQRSGNLWDEVWRIRAKNGSICFYKPIKGKSKTTKTYFYLLIHKNCTYLWKILDWCRARDLFVYRLPSVKTIECSTSSWSSTSRRRWSDWILEIKRIIFGTILRNSNIDLMKCGRVQWQEAEATRKNSLLYWFVRARNSPSSLRTLRTQSHWSFTAGHKRSHNWTTCENQPRHTKQLGWRWLHRALSGLRENFWNGYQNMSKNTLATRLNIGRDFAVTHYSPESCWDRFAIVSEHTVELKWLILNKHNKWSHPSRVKLPLVRMSASWFSVSMYLIWIMGSKLIRSNNQSSATLWVLETCLIVGFLLFMIILITASLSSNTYNKASLCENWTFEGTQSILFSTLVFPWDFWLLSVMRRHRLLCVEDWWLFHHQSMTDVSKNSFPTEFCPDHWFRPGYSPIARWHQTFVSTWDLHNYWRKFE